jgi:hypothetical protein
MTWTEDLVGTQAATLGTEHVLVSPTTNGTYDYSVDLSNLAPGEMVELRAYKKVKSTGGTLLQVWKGTFDYYGAQSNKVAEMPPLVAPYGCKFTLLQLNVGTGRNFDWAVNRI